MHEQNEHRIQDSGCASEEEQQREMHEEEVHRGS